MTNEEAIKLLDDISSYYAFTPYYEALEMAAKALEQQTACGMYERVGIVGCEYCKHEYREAYERSDKE